MSNRFLSIIVSVFLVLIFVVLSIFSVSASSTFTISFNANGGDGVIAAQNISQGTSQNLPQNTFNKNHYVFGGWAESPNGNVVYSDMGNITNLSDNLTLYAKWIMWGDADLSTTVTAQDTTEIQRYLARLTTMTDEQLVAADTDYDSRISVLDATRINLYLGKTYHVTVNSYYDKGFPVYYNETLDISREKINAYIDAISARYGQLLDLDIVRNNASYYQSIIDDCKGEVDSLNIDTLCEDGLQHTSRSKLISNFSYLNYSKDVTNIFWTCHKVTSTSSAGITDYNRSCSNGRKIMMLERQRNADRDTKLKGVLMHELNHQYGARDHYHELRDVNDSNSCKFKPYCSTCGTNPRPGTCLMCTGRGDISLDTVLCDGCKSEMTIWLSNNLS